MILKKPICILLLNIVFSKKIRLPKEAIIYRKRNLFHIGGLNDSKGLKTVRVSGDPERDLDGFILTRDPNSDRNTFFIRYNNECNEALASVSIQKPDDDKPISRLVSIPFDQDFKNSKFTIICEGDFYKIKNDECKCAQWSVNSREIVFEGCKNIDDQLFNFFIIDKGNKC